MTSSTVGPGMMSRASVAATKDIQVWKSGIMALLICWRPASHDRCPACKGENVPVLFGWTLACSMPPMPSMPAGRQRTRDTDPGRQARDAAGSGRRVPAAAAQLRRKDESVDKPDRSLFRGTARDPALQGAAARRDLAQAGHLDQVWRGSAGGQRYRVEGRCRPRQLQLIDGILDAPQIARIAQDVPRMQPVLHRVQPLARAQQAAPAQMLVQAADPAVHGAAPEPSEIQPPGRFDDVE